MYTNEPGITLHVESYLRNTKVVGVGVVGGVTTNSDVHVDAEKNTTTLSKESRQGLIH